MLGRIMVFAYGLIAYLLFLATFVYAAGFLANAGVPRTIDAPAAMPWAAALTIDLGLLALFAVQHSVMARPAFKRLLTRAVPVAAERSTYVLASSLALLLLFRFWEPIGGRIWALEDPVATGVVHALFALGLLTVLVSTFLIDHFDLFGLRQVTAHLLGRPYAAPRFHLPRPYRHVRHPLYVGWLLAFWAAPVMSGAHLAFAIATTLYIVVAIQLEERDLAVAHGEEYSEYKRKVPMLIPSWRRSV
jgi:protein-S-isoprenylcysteine O-methyltransferase Ste14